MNETDSYKTIKSPSEGLYKERGSKFMAFAFPVDNEDAVKKHQAGLRKHYFDARHHVYAFRIGADKKFYRYSDDGEPSNSSGPHVFGQIQSYDLTNILIVVVRYFGGTKLGIPGLINAYKSAAASAILNAEVTTQIDKHVFEITFQYSAIGDIMRIIKDNNLEIVKQEQYASCMFQIAVAKSTYKSIEKCFLELQNCEVSG